MSQTEAIVLKGDYDATYAIMEELPPVICLPYNRKLWVRLGPSHEFSRPPRERDGSDRSSGAQRHGYDTGRRQESRKDRGDQRLWVV